MSGIDTTAPWKVMCMDDAGEPDPDGARYLQTSGVSPYTAMSGLAT